MKKVVVFHTKKLEMRLKNDLDISDITACDLQNEILAPINIKNYIEQVTKILKDAGYKNILAGYVSSVFPDFESYLGTEIDSVGDDVKLVLDEYNSNFITYELEPGIYTFKDISKALFNIPHS